MGATVRLRRTEVSVTPGGKATLKLTVTNNGDVVDLFTLSVVGEAAAWSEPEHPSISLFPGAEETTQIVFHPPRSSKVQAGIIPFGVKVDSREDPQGSVVEEGVIDVDEFFDIGAELVPAGITGRKKGRANLAVDNRGNRALTAQLAAVDHDDILEFDFNPPAVSSQPGTANFSRVEVGAPRRFFRGPVRSFPFQIAVSPDGQEPVFASGTLLQKPLFPRGASRAILLALLLAVVALLLWFFFLKPAIKTAAKDAAEDALAVQDQRLAAQTQKNAQQDDAIQKLSEGTGVPVPTPVPEAVPTLAPAGGALGIPKDGTLFSERSPGQPPGADNTQDQSGTDNTFEVPDNNTVSITDLVLQNPEGDTGFVRILRDGRPLLQLRLENFRDIDYHFVSPLILGEGQRLRLSLNCENATPADTCRASLYYSGFIR